MEEVVRKICLDSDVLIELFRNNRQLTDKIFSLDAQFHTTSVSVFELWNSRKDEDKLSDFFHSITILNFDKNSGIIAGKISRQLKDNGEEVEFRDIFIGSICISNDVELFTLNVKHFERMKKFGLNLVKTN